MKQNLGRPIMAAFVVMLAFHASVAGFLHATPAEADGSLLGAMGDLATTHAFFTDSEHALDNTYTANFTLVVVPGCPFSAVVHKPPTGANMTGDPGFAFRDLDCDGVYDAGLDEPVPDAEILDGSYDAGAACLVIPPSVGPIVAGTISISSSRALTVLVNVTASTGAFTMDGLERLSARNVSFFSTVGNMLLQSTAGSIDLLGVHGHSRDGDIVVKQKPGSVGDLDLTRSRFNVTNNLAVTSIGDAFLEDTQLTAAHGYVQVTSSKGIFGADAVIRSPKNTVALTSNLGGIHMDRLLLDSDQGNFAPEVRDSFRVHDGCIRSGNNLAIDTRETDGLVNEWIDIPGSTLISVNGFVSIDAPRTWINMSRTDVQSPMKMTVRVDGDIWFDEARAEVPGGTITFALSDNANTIYVQNATFIDNDNKAIAKPNGVNIVGTPASGVIAYS